MVYEALHTHTHLQRSLRLSVVIVGRVRESDLEMQASIPVTLTYKKKKPLL